MKTESRRGSPAGPRTALPYKASRRFSRMAVNGGWPVRARIKSFDTREIIGCLKPRKVLGILQRAPSSLLFSAAFRTTEHK
eukprot:85167-Pyramimonas_sp.AAC.1